MNRVEVEQNGTTAAENGQHKASHTAERKADVSHTAETSDSSSSPAHENGEVQKATRSPAKRRRIAFIIIASIILIAALVLGFLPRSRQRSVAAADMTQLAIPTVSVISPTPGKPGQGLVLPEEIRPWREASIYARANGYLKDWVADIGGHVQPGQLLAEIETPELDQQLMQAKAQLVLAQANLRLAKV